MPNDIARIIYEAQERIVRERSNRLISVASSWNVHDATPLEDIQRVQMIGRAERSYPIIQPPMGTNAMPYSLRSVGPSEIIREMSDQGLRDTLESWVRYQRETLNPLPGSSHTVESVADNIAFIREIMSERGITPVYARFGDDIQRILRSNTPSQLTALRNRWIAARNSDACDLDPRERETVEHNLQVIQRIQREQLEAHKERWERFTVLAERIERRWLSLRRIAGTSNPANRAAERVTLWKRLKRVALHCDKLAAEYDAEPMPLSRIVYQYDF